VDDDVEDVVVGLDVVELVGGVYDPPVPEPLLELLVLPPEPA